MSKTFNCLGNKADCKDLKKLQGKLDKADIALSKLAVKNAVTISGFYKACKNFLNRVANASNEARFSAEAKTIINDSVDEIQQAISTAERGE